MKRIQDLEVEIEYKLVSDMSIRPEVCIDCGFKVLIRRSYRLIDLQDIGSPISAHDTSPLSSTTIYKTSAM
jgi:hypothetical protein